MGGAFEVSAAGMRFEFSMLLVGVFGCLCLSLRVCFFELVGRRLYLIFLGVFGVLVLLVGVFELLVLFVGIF